MGGGGTQLKQHEQQLTMGETSVLVSTDGSLSCSNVHNIFIKIKKRDQGNIQPETSAVFHTIFS